MRTLIKDRRGTATFEFVLVAPLIVMIVFAAFGFGNVAQQQIALQSAVKVGGEYARFYPADTNGIQNATKAALPSSMSLNSGSPTVTSACATGTLAGGNCTPPIFVTISATMPSTTITLPFWTGTFANAATYEIRVQ